MMEYWVNAVGRDLRARRVRWGLVMGEGAPPSKTCRHATPDIGMVEFTRLALVIILVIILAINADFG